MRNWLDPWPAISDLFSGLLVASFAGLILFAGVSGIERVREQRVRRHADEIRDKVLESLQTSLTGASRECGVEEICFDIAIQFETDQDRIKPPYKEAIGRACSALRETLGTFDRRQIEIVIEGHTDSRQPQRAASPRDAYLYNWRLSSNRASSVLYEFAQCGVKPPDHRIFAIGYADSDSVPGCEADTETCNAVNRRTTFRLRPDKNQIKNDLADRQ